MLLKTILNHRHKFKSFVYGNDFFEGDNLIIEVHPRINSHPFCSVCRSPAPCYDVSPEPRRFEFVPFWGIKVFFSYSMRRVECRICGNVKVEYIPWAEGKSTLTKALALFLADWAKALSWKEVATRFQMSWRKVYESVEQVVRWGMANRSLEGIRAIGVDEISRGKGYKFLTLVYQLDGACRRLLWVAEDRGKESLSVFFEMLGEKLSSQIKYVCSDMWKPYLKIIAQKASAAIHVLDRFHIVQWMNKAVDMVRHQEHQDLLRRGIETLKYARWCLLKCRKNLTKDQKTRLSDLLRQRLKSVRAYLLKEIFQRLWSFTSVGWAGRFIDRWTTMAMRSRIEPMKRVARNIRLYRGLILNWIGAKNEVSLGAVEGYNNKAKVTTKKAYGFRTFKCLEMALFHTLGALPMQQLTHRLW
jgi:transposase